MKENNEKNNYEKIEVKTKKELDELYNCSAFTIEGIRTDEEDINGLINWIKQYSAVSDPLPIHIISGKLMNDEYHLTGNNRYPNDLNIISIKNNDIKNLDKIIMPRFSIGGRWFDDIVNNNSSREEIKEKPKCALIGKDGNIFNLMGIASRTLKQNGMQEEATEMVNKITSSAKSYEEALCIIDKYVDIVSEEDLDEEEEMYE